MANVCNKMQMTDGTICDIFEWALDLTGVNLDILNTAQNVSNIANKIREIIPSFSTTTDYNRPVFIHGLLYNDVNSGNSYFCTPVSGIMRYGTDGAETVLLVYIDIPGYTIEVYSNNTVIVRRNITTRSAIVRPDVTVTADELRDIIKTLKNGGELLYFNTSTYFTIRNTYHLFVPQGGAPAPITVTDWFNDDTKIGSLTLVYIYWAGASSKSEAGVVFTRDSQGNITINVPSPHN